MNPSAEGETEVIVRLLLTAIAILALSYGIWWQLLRQLSQPDAPLGGLAVGIVAATLFGALVDYGIAVHTPGQFIGLSTRIDALYFALSTLFTVGFGDVTAAGQLARAVLCIQMLINVVVIASVASYIVREIVGRARARRAQDS